MDDIGGNMKLHTIIEEYNKKYIDIILSLLNNIKDFNYEKRTFIGNSLHYQEENLEITIKFFENIIDSLIIRDKNDSYIYYTKSLLVNIEPMPVTDAIKQISDSLFNKYF